MTESDAWEPILIGVRAHDNRAISIGHPLVDDYLRFVAARARLNSLLAAAYDLKVFFTYVRKQPTDVTTDDVFSFIADQRAPRRGNVVRLIDGESGLSARTIKRRLTSVSGLFAYLITRGDVGVMRNPVPRGLASRRPRMAKSSGGVPLVRAPRTLPSILAPAEVNALLGALRTKRDVAMVLAMVLGGLRRSEVIGLRLNDVNAGEKRLFVAESKGGHQRSICVSSTFMNALSAYLTEERGDCDHDRVFVVLKGTRRGQPLSTSGLEQIITSAKDRAGLGQVTCHQLRHTCFTRLREAGMSLEALQAQAGHRSLDSTRLYLHLGDSWFAQQYHDAITSLEADLGT